MNNLNIKLTNINIINIISLNPKLITPNNTPHNIIATYNNLIHMYAIFITLGIICSVLVCFFKLKLKKIPTEPLIWSIFIIIPFSLFGASFFGKFNNDINNPLIIETNDIPILSLFAFWKAGMSIHGGVLFGTISGLIFFSFISKKTNVSIWIYTDCIIPNILLGQIIGRWGNFFNHELLGSITSYDSLYWLMPFIRDNSWQWDGLSPEINQFGQIVFRHPIFLYESFFNFLAWFFITFFVPIIGQLFSKKPWKKNIEKYPFDLKYSFFHFFNKKYIKYDKMTWKEIWNKAYFDYMPNQKQLNKIFKKNRKKNNIKRKLFFINIFKKKLYNNSNELTKLNNPENYLITRCGVQTGFYFFLWNLIRFILEIQRDNDTTLFIKNNRILDYTIIILISLIGLVIIIYTQWLAPQKFRKNGFIYEKEYINLYDLQTWWRFKNYLNSNIIIGEDNFINKLPIIIKTKITNFLGYNNNKYFEKYFNLKYFKTSKQEKNNNEIINYKFKITTLPKKNNKFFNEIIINQSFKFNLKKILYPKILKISKNNNSDYYFLTKQQFKIFLCNIINNSKKINEIKNIWYNIFPCINEQKTTIFNINFNDLIIFDKLKISQKTKKIKIKFKENEFYYFDRKINFKLKWK